MSTRSLSNYEIFDLLSRHADTNGQVQNHEQDFLVQGHPYLWDQTVSTMSVITTDGNVLTMELPIPPRGLAVEDNVYGHVIIFPDASGILHYTATDNSSLMAEIQKPSYVSDPAYWQLFGNIAQQFGEAVAGAVPHIEFSLGSIAVILVALVFLVRR